MTEDLVISERALRIKRMGSFAGQSFLLLITSCSALAVLFIFFFIARDAIPFFKAEGFKEFFTTLKWYPSGDPASFGALAIFFGSGMVTLGAVLVAVPLGIAAAVCLSDILSFSARQYIKPVIEILAAIPSVAYGFFALVIFAPLLQESGGKILSAAFWVIALPLSGLAVLMLSDLTGNMLKGRSKYITKIFFALSLSSVFLYFLFKASGFISSLTISSGTNSLNVSIILGVMALPTVVSVSEDALQSVGRELREGSYALGATRAETIVKVILPAAASGICAAVILGVMRAIGETMVVWMASGNAAQIPSPWFNFLEPVRTLTATIAGDMGEADHVTGSSRYHVLFAMALSLLTISYICNAFSEWFVRRIGKKTGKL